jgi:O-antigen/teichoic acid export membrane protein
LEKLVANMGDPFFKKARIVAPSAAIGYLASFAFLALAGRTLGPSEFAEFSIFWGSFFFIGSVVAAVELESARQFALSNKVSEKSNGIFLATAVFTIAVAAVALIVNSGSYLIGDTSTYLLITGITLLSLTGVTRGALISSHTARSYSFELILEGALRLAGILILIFLSLVSKEALVAITMLGLAACLPFVRVLGHARGTLPFFDSLRNIFSLAAANIGAALVISAPIAMIGVYSQGSEYAVAGLIAGLTISRIPLMATSLIQPLLIPFFVSSTDRMKLDRKVIAYSALTVGLSTIGLVLLGPTLVKMFFGAMFQVDLLVMLVLVITSWILAVAIAIGSWLIAGGSHLLYATSWILGGLYTVLLFVYVSPDVIDSALICLSGSTLTLVASLLAVRLRKSRTTP